MYQWLPFTTLFVCFLTLPKGRTRGANDIEEQRYADYFRQFWFFDKLKKERRRHSTKLDLELNEQFNRYRRCLAFLNLDIQKGRMESTLLLQEGDKLLMKCKTCFRPDQDSDDVEMKWTKKPVYSNVKAVLVPDEHLQISPEWTINVNQVNIDDAGRYICYRNNVHMAIYRVDVIRREKRDQVYEAGLKGKLPSPPVELHDNNLLLFSKWEPWSPCNRCNKRGERTREGICTVKKLDATEPVTPKDFKIFSKFPDGVPCRSTLMPLKIYTIPEIKARHSESQLGYCFEICPTLPSKSYKKNKLGEIVEVVDKKSGYISMKDGYPTVPPSVVRKSIFATIGKAQVLECPDPDAQHKSIRWQNDTQVIDLIMLRRKFHGRVKVDVQNRLIIQKVLATDTAPYSCWHNGHHIATISLTAKDPIWDRNMDDYVIFAGLFLTLVVLGNVVMHVVKGRNRRTLR